MNALGWSTASFQAFAPKANDDGPSSMHSSLLWAVDDGPLQGSDGIGAVGTAVNLVKCCAGCGMFSLPYAFKQGGLYLSIGCTVFFGVISAYTVDILAHAELKARAVKGPLNEPIIEDVRDALDALKDESQEWRSSLAEDTVFSIPEGGPVQDLPLYLTYPELGRKLFPEVVLFGVNWAQVAIYVGISATSLGVCAAYFDFIAATMNSVIPSVSQTSWKLIVGAIMAPLSLLRTFKYLAWSSVMGNFGVVAALVAVIAAGIGQYDDLLPNNSTKVNPLTLPAAEANTFPQFFGAAAFLFAIHMIVLPLSQAMYRPDRDFTRVAYTSYGIITVLNVVFAAACYMLFQDDTGQMITSNIPNTGAWEYINSVVLVLLSIAMLFTIPMILSASREIIEESVLVAVSKGDPLQYEEMIRNAVRLTLVAIILGLVFAVKDFNDMVNLVGGLANCLMGFILPPLLHIRVNSPPFGEGISPLSKVFHYAIVVFGLGTMITATVVTVKHMINPDE